MAKSPPVPLSAAGARRLIIGIVIFVCAVLWVVGFFAWLGVSLLENRACGLDPLTGYETGECAPLRSLNRVMFFAWLFAPVGCALLAALITFIPRRMRGARLAALWLLPLWPLSIVVGGLWAAQLS